MRYPCLMPDIKAPPNGAFGFDYCTMTPLFILPTICTQIHNGSGEINQPFSLFYFGFGYSTRYTGFLMIGLLTFIKSFHNDWQDNAIDMSDLFSIMPMDITASFARLTLEVQRDFLISHQTFSIPSSSHWMNIVITKTSLTLSPVLCLLMA